MLEVDDLTEVITLCICSYRRPDLLEVALQSVADCGGPRIGVLVSDDSPDPGPTQEVVARHPFARWVQGPRQGVGPNRASCPGRVSTPYLTFIDDDARVRHGYTQTLARLLAGMGEREVVTGSVVNHFTDGTEQLSVPGSADFLGFATRPWGAGHGNMIEMNATLFPTAAFEEVGFDELLRYGYEEIDLSRQLAAAGYRLRHDPELLLDHHPGTTPLDARPWVDSSRLYATMKHYTRIAPSPARALAYALLAPAHHIAAGALHRRRGLTAAGAVKDVVVAAKLLRSRAGSVPT